MPSKRRKFSAFAKILLILTFVCSLFVAGAYYVLTTFEPLNTEEAPEPGCRLTLSDGTYELEADQAVNMTTVGGVAYSRDLPEEAVTVAYATVWQESRFYNIGYGDRDSVGLFQQRPSQEWGDPEEIMDPVFASRSFYDALIEVDGWEDMPVYEAAQQVQRSAHGFAYDQHETLSRRMAEAFTGGEGTDVTCWFDAETAEALREGEADTAGAEEEIARVFGTDPAVLPVDSEPRTGDLGRAMAQWAVTHAEEYGLSSVSYENLRWRASDGMDGAEQWTELEESTDGRLVLR